MIDDPRDKWLTPSEAVRRLGGARVVAKLIAQGKLRTRRTSVLELLRIRAEDVETQRKRREARG